MTQRLAAPAIVLLAAFVIRAQEPQREGGRGGFGPPRGFAIFQALDSDHDNTLTAAEMDGAPAVLNALDKNGDARISGDEFPVMAGRGRGEGRGRGGSGIGDEPPAAPPTPDEMAAMLMAFDKNHDGKLAKAEVPERMRGMLERVDRNHDGVLTADEIKTGAAALPQPTTNPGGVEGRRGEGGRDGRGGPPADRLMTALDKDGDGMLSADEIAAAPAALRTLDTDADGKVSPEELFGGRGRG